MNTQNFDTKRMQLVYVVDDGTTKYCPPKGVDNIDLHPRVALQFNHNKAVCPYCGIAYQIKKQ